MEARKVSPSALGSFERERDDEERKELWLRPCLPEDKNEIDYCF